MKLIILRDLLKLDFSESLPGLHGTSIFNKKARGNMLLKSESHISFKALVTYAWSPYEQEVELSQAIGEVQHLLPNFNKRNSIKIARQEPEVKKSLQ